MRTWPGRYVETTHLVKPVKKSFAEVAKGKFDCFVDYKLDADFHPMIWPSGKRTALVWLNADSSGREPQPSRYKMVFSRAAIITGMVTYPPNGQLFSHWFSSFFDFHI